MEQIMSYLKPELLVLAPVLYFVGLGLKGAQSVPDKHIPLWLGLAGVGLSVLWVLATSVFTGWQSILLAVFTGVVQGILCAGCSVYANQMIKQESKSTVSPTDYMKADLSDLAGTSGGTEDATSSENTSNGNNVQITGTVKEGDQE